MTDERLILHFGFTLSSDQNSRAWGIYFLLKVNYCVNFMCNSFFSAEQFFEFVEECEEYGIVLLDLISGTHTSETIRLAGATALKNYVKKKWNGQIVRKLV